MASRSLYAATCLLLITACGSAPEPKAGQSQVSAKGVTATQRLNPGLWQQTGTLANSAGPAQSRCISPQEAVSANGTDTQIREALAAQAAKDDCTIRSVTINGPTIAWAQTCGGTTVSMSTDYRGDSSTTTMSGGGLRTMTTESVRIGDC